MKTKDLLAQMMNCDAADVLTSSGAADLLGIGVRGVTAAAKRQRLPGLHIGEGKGGAWYFRRSDVEAYAASKQTWKAADSAAEGGEEDA